ncbi:class I SAM-dependent methyltransferase [Anabaena subtropica]|uniref:Methyltransferase domain-containing protein n=1 Tax=Anabaena subtropica FACHB-260 TaxID=2692884 RepID=A0ABR8CTF0_9NOST|nr:class I SAM-dependent methyltransferase [Anabaena subtropica]MBD2345477.1 methyltransferase domain-containing protein [Anabaena subtropica FACHB-260]
MEPRKTTQFNSSRFYLEKFVREAAESLPSTAIILDAGAGNCPYKPLFSHVQYESADFCQFDSEYGEIDYVCDLTSIPVENNKYDLVICNQVIEHIPEPEATLKELYRVLKPNGQLWLSAPFFYEEHGIPYDFYRYTQFGHKYLFEKIGFEIKKIERLEGYYGTLAYQLETASKSLPANPRFYGGSFSGLIGTSVVLISRPLFKLLSFIFSWLDIKYKNVVSGYCKNYIVVAEKPNI